MLTENELARMRHLESVPYESLEPRDQHELEEYRRALGLPILLDEQLPSSKPQREGHDENFTIEGEFDSADGGESDSGDDGWSEREFSIVAREPNIPE